MRSATRKSAVDRAQMAQLTGLCAGLHPADRTCAWIPTASARELLRDRHQIIGRIDSRYVGTEPDNVGEGADYDPQGKRDHRRASSAR